MLVKTKTVSEIVGLVANLIDDKFALNTLAIEGQISNLSKSSAGHFYFNLIDENALIKCVFFRGSAIKNKVELKEGDSIVVCGHLQVYQKSGTLQVRVTSVVESKESYLRKLFLELQNKLQKKGYFDLDRKRPLPASIKKIGLITSKNSAAIKDFLTTLKPRNPFIEIYLIDVRVQGNTTGLEVSNAIKQFQEFDDIDLIVITRGGGSKDELFVFNDELICDAAFNSKIPILSAVGHEIDKSLLDYTADIYSSTPTQAAQIISDNIYISVNTLPIKLKNLDRALAQRFSYQKIIFDSKLNKIETYLTYKIREGKNYLTNVDNKLQVKTQEKLNSDKLKLEQSIKLLESYNVNNVLSRGFAILKQDGKVITSSKTLQKQDKLQIEMADFVLNVSVDEVIKK